MRRLRFIKALRGAPPSWLACGQPRLNSCCPCHLATGFRVTLRSSAIWSLHSGLLFVLWPSALWVNLPLKADLPSASRLKASIQEGIILACTTPDTLDAEASNDTPGAKARGPGPDSGLSLPPLPAPRFPPRPFLPVLSSPHLLLTLPPLRRLITEGYSIV